MIRERTMKKREEGRCPDNASEPHAPRQKADQPAGAAADDRDPKAGIAREVGDLEDPDAEGEGALPGRVGGGLAGG
jgi:hypothetical protein